MPSDSCLSCPVLSVTVCLYVTLVYCGLTVSVDMTVQWDNNFIDVTYKLQQYIKTTNNL